MPVAATCNSKMNTVGRWARWHVLRAATSGSVGLAKQGREIGLECVREPYKRVQRRVEASVWAGPPFELLIPPQREARFRRDLLLAEVEFQPSSAQPRLHGVGEALFIHVGIFASRVLGAIRS